MTPPIQSNDNKMSSMSKNFMQSSMPISGPTTAGLIDKKKNNASFTSLMTVGKDIGKGMKGGLNFVKEAVISSDHGGGYGIDSGTNASAGGPYILKTSLSAQQFREQPASSLNIAKSLTAYMRKMIGRVSGPKALILDTETSGIMSLVITLSEVNAMEVLLIENIERFPNGEGDWQQQLHHMKAVVFIRPTLNALEQLGKMLHSPRYREYYVHFSNLTSASLLENLAEKDDFNRIIEVHEFFADIFVATPILFHMNAMEKTIAKLPSTIFDSFAGHAKIISDRNVGGVLSSLFALQKQPDIRYSAAFKSCSDIAHIVAHVLNDNNEIIKPSSDERSLLLIIDRHEDPVTPLLLPWTYSAMIHELLNIDLNKVDLSKVPNFDSLEKNGLKEITLSVAQDDFYAKNQFSNWGELAVNVRSLVDKFRKTHSIHGKLDSIEDMQRFVENYSEIRHEQGTMQKHMAIIAELQRLIAKRSLLEISKLEQELVCGTTDHEAIFEDTQTMVNRADVGFYDKLRVVCLYALRFENHADCKTVTLQQALNRFASKDDERKRISVVTEMIRQCGAKLRKNDLFSDRNIKGLLKIVKTTVHGVDNIYTQHKPYLYELAQQILSGDLKTSAYPFIESQKQLTQHTKLRYKHVIIFVVGGVTYEEELVLHQLSEKERNSVRFVLGGSNIQNSCSFLDTILPVEENLFESPNDVIIQLNK